MEQKKSVRFFLKNGEEVEAIGKIEEDEWAVTVLNEESSVTVVKEFIVYSICRTLPFSI